MNFEFLSCGCAHESNDRLTENLINLQITASKTNILGLTVQGSVHFVSPAAYLWCDIPKFSNVRDITTHFTEETCVFHLMEENLVAKNVAEDESISHIFLNNGIDEIFAILYQKSYRSFNPQIKFGCDTAQRTLCEDIAGLWNSVRNTGREIIRGCHSSNFLFILTFRMTPMSRFPSRVERLRHIGSF